MCSEVPLGTEGSSLNVSSLLLHHFCCIRNGVYVFGCLSLCRNSSSSVVTFSMPLRKPKMKFFVFTCAASLLFTVLSLFLVEEAAMLMLETEGPCFQKIQEWQSAPDRELLYCYFSVDAGPADTSPLALHRCVVSVTEPVRMQVGAPSLSRILVTVFCISRFLS